MQNACGIASFDTNLACHEEVVSWHLPATFTLADSTMLGQITYEVASRTEESVALVGVAARKIMSSNC